MSRRDPRARAMLRAYREATGYDPEQRDAVWERIEASLDRAGTEPSIEGPARPPRWIAVGAAVVATAAAAALLSWAPWRGASGTTERAPSQQAPRTRREDAPRTIAPPPARDVRTPGAPSPTPAPPPSPASTDEPAPSPRARSGSRDPGRPEPSATEDAGASVGDELRAELVLIGKARRALQADDPQRALELLDAHARAFPQGQMREDRQVLRIEALCAADKGQQARAEARQLLRTYPGSAHAGRVREACPAR